MEPEFHARATYRHKTDRKRKIDLFVYSSGESAPAFELYVSTEQGSVRGGKAEIISGWRQQHKRLNAEGFLLDSVNIADRDFDLQETKAHSQTTGLRATWIFDFTRKHPGGVRQTRSIRWR
jgi:hypothetical protein